MSSLTLKAWAVTVVAVIATFAITVGSPTVAIVALVPAGCFLWLERSRTAEVEGESPDYLFYGALVGAVVVLIGLGLASEFVEFVWWRFLAPEMLTRY